MEWKQTCLITVMKISRFAPLAMPVNCRQVSALIVVAMITASSGPTHAQEKANTATGDRAGTTGYRMIDAARGAAVAFATSLPDYILKRTTTRYQGRREDKMAVSGTWEIPAVDHWIPLDSVTADVASEHGRDVYTNVTVNGKPVKTLPTGTWSTGEFSSTLLEILSPESASQFTNQRRETIRNRQSYRYDYLIDQAHSVWHLIAERLPEWLGTEKYTPAHGGAIWIDSQTAQVLRIEKTARGPPNSFPLDVVLQTTDYDFVKITDRQYCLPIHSETVSCVWGNNTLCWRNETGVATLERRSRRRDIGVADPVRYGIANSNRSLRKDRWL